MLEEKGEKTPQKEAGKEGSQEKKQLEEFERHRSMHAQLPGEEAKVK